MALFPSIRDGDWAGVRKALQKLGSANGLGPTSTPTFAGLTLTNLTASRLISTDSTKALSSVTDLTTWIAGTANEINVADDGDGTITIGIVDPLIVAKGGSGAATFTDHGILLGSGTGAFTALGVATNGQLPIGSTGVDPVLAALTGTANRVTVTNGAGSITLSGPQDIHTAASPTFTGMMLSANLVIDASTTVPYNPANYSEGLRINRASNDYVGIHFGGVATTTSGTANGEWTINRLGDGTAAFRIYNNTDNGNGITILTTGEVGIGDTTPATAFEVNGTITAADLSLSVPSLVYGLNHDSFTGFVTNEHIDHSTVSITAGTGMSGGGDITTSRTLNCTITQYTDELVDDRVAALIQNGTGLSWTYDDVANTLTGNVSITQYTNEMAQDTIGAALTDTSSIDFTYNDVANTIEAAVLPAGVDHDALLNFVTGEHVAHAGVSILAGTGMSGGGDITVSRTLNCTITQYTDELVDDRVAVLIQNGTGLTWTYDDVANTLTGNVSITQYTDEMAQDTIGTILTDSSSIDFTYDDVANTITAAVLPAGVDHDSLLNFAANEHFLQTAITNVSTGLATGLLKVTTGTGALSVITDSSANWDSAYTHITSTGDDHTWLNQDVTTAASPTYVTLILGNSGDTYVILRDPNNTDADGGRVGRVPVQGYTAAGALHALGEIKFSHFGSAADQAGKCDIALNSGNQAFAPDVNFSFRYRSLYIRESAGAQASEAALGQLWVRNDTPNTLWFTNDAAASISITPSVTATTLGIGVTTLNISGNMHIITGDGGGNTIATITNGFSGMLLTLVFVDSNVTITDDNTHAANSIDLSAAFTSADDTVLLLVFDGTSWYEVSRSTN